MSTEARMAPDTRRGPEGWVDQHGDALFRYALLRLGDAAQAEEVVQETFLAALQSYRNFAGDSSERTWLVGILRHKITDHFRRASKQRPLEEAADFSSANDGLFMTGGEWPGHWDFEIGPARWGETPAAALEQAEFRRALEGCLAALPERQATAFVLREMEEMSGEEVCRVLEITAANLWVLLHRARAQLRLCIETKWFRRRESR
jgi:RNA polymerase sigma-70 factor, ECF subfamily